MAGLIDIPVDKLALGTKARRALRELRVHTVREFLQLDVNRVLRLPSIGKGTRDQLLALQQWVSAHSPRLQGAGGGPSAACPFDDLESIKKQLTARARHVLDRLRVTTIADLLNLRPEGVLEEPWMGVRTWAEIAGLQERLKCTPLTPTGHSDRTGTWHGSARKGQELPRVMAPSCTAERRDIAIDFSSFETMVRSFLVWTAGSVSGASLMIKPPSRSGTAADGNGSSSTRDTSDSVQSADVRTLRRLAATLGQLDLSPLNPLWTTVTGILLGAGGVVNPPQLSEGIAQRMDWAQAPAASDLATIVTLHAGFRVDEPSGTLVSTDCPCVTCTEPVAWVGDIVRSHSGSVHLVDVGYHLAAQCRLRCESSVSIPKAFNEAFVRFVVGHTSEYVARDERVYAAAHRRPQNANSLRDAIRRCLEAWGRPAHYTEIAEWVRKTYPRYSEASDNRVYQCLYLDRRFVRVRRGIFALTAAPMACYGQPSGAGEEPPVPCERPIRGTDTAVEAWHSENAGVVQVQDTPEAGDRMPVARRIGWDTSVGTRHEHVATRAQDLVMTWDDGSDESLEPSAMQPPERVQRYSRDMSRDHLAPCSTSRLPRRPQTWATKGHPHDSEVERLLRSATSRLQRSYKPVLVLAILDSLDGTGRCSIRAVVRSFSQFYVHRMQSGLIPEGAGSSIVSALDGSGNVDLDRVQLIVERHPLRILRQARLLSVHGDEIVMNRSLLAALESSGAVEHVRRVLRAAVSEYFGRLSVIMT